MKIENKTSSILFAMAGVMEILAGVIGFFTDGSVKSIVMNGVLALLFLSLSLLYKTSNKEKDKDDKNE